MDQHLIYSGLSMLLFCLGLYGVMARENLLRKIMALNVMGSGVFLFLVSVARRDAIEYVDPVPQAMVLTGIVVALSATAFALALARRIHRESGEETSRAVLEETKG